MQEEKETLGTLAIPVVPEGEKPGVEHMLAPLKELIEKIESGLFHVGHCEFQGGAILINEVPRGLEEYAGSPTGEYLLSLQILYTVESEVKECQRYERRKQLLEGISGN